MAKAKTPVKEEAQITVTEGPAGEIYVSNSSSYTYFVKPKIDASKIYDLGKNNYVTEQLERLKALLFSGTPSFVVLDPKGEEDTELETMITSMCEAADVKLWSMLQVAWADIFQWGCALLNPVWGRGKDGSFTIQKLRRLPPESFGTAPKEMKDRTVWSEILRGIVYNSGTKKVEYWQTATQDGDPVMLDENAIQMLKDPTSTELAGTSKMIPVVPLISMLDFAWQAQMQKTNRVGAPIMFLKVTNPKVDKVTGRDDITYASTILKNWGKGTGYQLRENMDVIELNFWDNQTALMTIERLEKRISDYFSPSALIKKDGNTIGASGTAEADMVGAWIGGIHTWIADQFEKIIQQYLDVNAFEGYTVEIEIPIPEPDKTVQNIQKVTAGHATQCLTVNEKRELLGLSDLKPEEAAALAKEYAASKPPSSPFGFKEHEKTPEEVELDRTLSKSAENLKDKVLKALAEERGS